MQNEIYGTLITLLYHAKCNISFYRKLRSSDGLNLELPTEMAEIKVAKKIIFSPGKDSWSSPQIIPQGDFHI